MERVGKHVLVTGGAGFLGSHLCERLMESLTNVLCIDDYSTGSKENIDHLLGKPRFEFRCRDVIEPLHVKVDEIYNLACPASPVHYQLDPVKTIRTNVLGTISMLELARKAKARILQASTSEVYGDPKLHPQPESYLGNVNTIGPRACYDEGKRCAETLFFDYHRQYGVDIRVARIFNTYGPRMKPDDGRVIPTFIVRALAGKSLAVHGDGRQTRSFCYVDDMVDGLVKLMAGENMGPINLGNPVETTIKELADLVICETASLSDIIHLPLPKDDPMRRCPAITHAREVLDWQPVVPLIEGLRKTITYFQSR